MVFVGDKYIMHANNIVVHSNECSNESLYYTKLIV